MTIWKFKIWRNVLIWGSPRDVTTYINNVLPHLMIQQIGASNVLPQINKKNLILTTKLEKFKINNLVHN